MSSEIGRKMIGRRRFLRLAIVQTSAIALIGACAPAAPPAPTQAVKPAGPAPTQAAAQAPKPAAPTAAPAVTTKQELVIAQGNDPQNLDPHVVNQQSTRNITQVVNPALTDWDYSKKAIVGLLATEWKLLNPTTWQLKLRSGVKFSNGEPFNAEVAKYNLDRVPKPETKSGYLIFVSDIASTEIVDAQTLNIVTKAPSPMLPLNLTKLGIVPQQYSTEKGYAGMSNAPIGAGPYRVVEFVRDDRVILEPNPTYWGEKPIPTKVTFRTIPEPASRVAALKTGRADIINLVPAADVKSIESDANLGIIAQPGMRGMYIIINTLKYDTPLKDKRVRQALNYAVDKESLIKNILNGFGAKLNGSIVSPPYLGYNEKLQPYPYDPDKAKALLAEAGQPNGFEISFTTPQGRYMADKELSEAISGQLAKVGVKAKVVVKDWSVITQEIGDQTAGPLAFMGLAQITDATLLLGMHVTGVRNSYWSYPEFDKLVVEARQTMDDGKRADLLRKAAEVLREEANVIFLHQQYDLYGHNKRVQNLKPSPDEWIDVTKLSVK